MLLEPRITNAVWQSWIAQWAELLQSGMPVLDALELSIELQGPCRAGKLLRTKLQLCLQFLKSGQNLQTAFRAAFGALPQALEVALLCAQANGDLAQTLTEQLQRWKSSSEAQQALGKSLVYPAVVLCMAIACWVFLNQVSAPHLHTTTTRNTNSAFQLADLMMTFGGILLLLCGLIHATVKRRADSENWLPHHAWITSDFYHVISCELQAGLDLMHCLRHRSATSSRWMKLFNPKEEPLASLNSLCASTQRHLKDGLPLSLALKHANAPDFLIRQSQLAEQTGNLSHCFLLAAKVYEMRARRMQQKLHSLLPPLALAMAAATLAMAYQFTLAPLYANLGGLS